MEKVFVGIGSNLADPVQQVIDVIPMLDGIRNTGLLDRSSLYRTEAIGDVAQDDFINAVVELETGLDPLELLLELQAIEHACYRRREQEQRWGPRTMDLDILMFGDRHQRDSHLTLPHPRLQERLFVLLPLMEVRENLYIPGLGSVKYMINHAPQMRIERLDDPPGLNYGLNRQCPVQ